MNYADVNGTLPPTAEATTAIDSPPTGRGPAGFRNMIAAQSNHPGGVNVGFLDGSAKFIENSVNPGTWGRSRPRPAARSSTPAASEPGPARVEPGTIATGRVASPRRDAAARSILFESVFTKPLHIARGIEMMY
jgi:prepilin-type processing-associated H-X9-DG protein